MLPIKRLFITGYRSFELGIFQEKDEKIRIIKNVLRNRIREYLDQGLEWIIIGGNLGTEYWVSEVVEELSEDFPELKLSILFPFEEFGGNWNEQNQQNLSAMKQRADYVNAVSHKPYENPSQLKNHTIFILEHTDASLLLYDEEYEGKTMYFVKDAKKYQEQNEYELDFITMDDLQNYEFY